MKHRGLLFEIVFILGWGFLPTGCSSDMSPQTLQTELRSHFGSKGQEGESQKRFDIEFSVSNGQTTHLSNLTADYTLVLLSSAHTPECDRIKQTISKALPVKKRMTTHSRLKLRLVSIQTNHRHTPCTASSPNHWINGTITPGQEIEESHLPPYTLYLLDKQKQILIKSNNAEEIISQLTTI